MSLRYMFIVSKRHLIFHLEMVQCHVNYGVLRLDLQDVNVSIRFKNIESIKTM